MAKLQPESERNLNAARPGFEAICHEIEPCVEAVRAALDDAGLSPSLFTCEQEIEWEYGGIRCRGTPDAVLVEANTATIWDLKLTKSIGNQHEMGKHATHSGWPIQREAYVTAIETLHPEVAGRVSWYWVIAEYEFPYDVRIVPASASMVELGRLQWERAVIMWRELVESGWSEPWSSTWTGGLEAPEYLMMREAAALDELIGGAT